MFRRQAHDGFKSLIEIGYGIETTFKTDRVNCFIGFLELFAGIRNADLVQVFNKVFIGS